MAENITFVGMGKFGTALAYQFDKTDRYNIMFYTRDSKCADMFNESLSNSRCFGEFKFKNAKATSLAEKAFIKSKVVFLTIASKDTIEMIAKIGHLIKPKTKIILCSKGLSENKPYFYSEIIRKFISKNNGVYVMSGPNFADEIINNESTITTLAGKRIIKTKFTSLLFRGTNIKIESSNDIVGLQIFGAMKNVMAIAVGILEGLGCGKNRTIATIMNFVKEIQKLNRYYGGKKNTAYLSGGIGDIMLTCFDAKSRNKNFGLRIGKGEDIEMLLQEYLVEGYYAIKAIRNMSSKMPRIDKKNLIYINSLYEILYEGANPSILKSL